MSFDIFSNTYTPIIDTALQENLEFHFTDNRHILEKAILYSATSKAKRIRPLIVLATFRLFSFDIKKIMPLAIAIEMIHAYSLIHDDLPAMDDDNLRRGQASCHIKFGEDIAILAGDSLNTFAFELLSAQLPRHYEAKQVLVTINEFAHACGIFGMAGGQALDLKAAHSQHDITALEQIHQLKTGAIIQACITLPAKLENAPKNDIHLLETLGSKVGLLFQITDDILDVKGDSQSLGKTAGKDSEQNKLTYVSLWGLEKAEKVAEETLNEALSLLHQISFKSFQDLEDIIVFIHKRSS